MPTVFDPKALHAALDAQRTARHMSWDQLARDLGVDLSTIHGMEERTRHDTDSVLQMTRWLGLNIESFIGEGRDGGLGPDPGDWRSTGRMVRFDAKALYAAVETRRLVLGLSWQEAAEAIAEERVTAPMLLHLKRGGRIELMAMLAIVQWLHERTATFARLTTT